MTIKQFANAPKFAKLQILAIAVQNDDRAAIAQAMQTLIADPAFASIAWQTNFAKLQKLFVDCMPRFSIFAMGGNSKLPFVSFSTLPGVTCPGAGDCIDFCYSYRAWRYPAAFARMVQNAFLMRFAPAVIHAQFTEIAAKQINGFDFRLYVDGDFSCVNDVKFWMNLLHFTPNARAYGYSKSFAVLLAYDFLYQWPTNYQLNISSGHNASEAMVNYIRALPVTRGEFIAVSIGRKVKSSDHGKPETNAAIRKAMGDIKVFPCPGACGNCTGKGHACGMPAMKHKVIAIAMH